MNVLVTGADGFVGRHVVQALIGAGHAVVGAVRRGSGNGRQDVIETDFEQDTNVAVWLPRLRNIDLVINCVGIIVERPGRSFANVHTKTPQALFSACAQAKVHRIIQISALGADAGGTAPYHVSKHAADDHLMGLDLDWSILQPSLVYGTDGASSRYFRMLASLPFTPVPGQGGQWVQPVHIGDLCAVVMRIVESGALSRQRLAVVGPEPMRYREMLQTLRSRMDLTSTFVFPVPMTLLLALTRITERLPGNLLTRDTLGMLERGNTANAEAMAQVLGQAPRSYGASIPTEIAPALRLQAQWDWLMPVTRVSLALVWLWSGIVSLGVYPLSDSLALLQPFHITGGLAWITLFMLAGLDLIFGLLTLLKPCKRLWLGQLCVVAGYTLAITLGSPAYWLHPFGPVLKNLTVLSVLLILLQTEVAA